MKKRYSRKEIAKAMKEGKLLEVEDFVQTKYIEIDNSEYNQEIIDNNGIYSNMSCSCYDKNKNLKGINFKLGAFIQVWN